MSDMLEFDEEASRAVEEVYGTDDVVEQRRIVMAALAPRPGERALDLHRFGREEDVHRARARADILAVAAPAMAYEFGLGLDRVAHRAA